MKTCDLTCFKFGEKKERKNKQMKESMFSGHSLHSGLQQHKEQKLLDIASHI